MRSLFDAQPRRVISPVHVYAQKTRIVFQPAGGSRGDAAPAIPAGHLWLKRRRQHRCIHRVESLLARLCTSGSRRRRHRDGFREREAYAVGSQEASPEDRHSPA